MGVRLILAQPCTNICLGDSVSSPSTVNPTNVGINTETPATPLDVNGNVTFRGELRTNQAIGLPTGPTIVAKLPVFDPNGTLIGYIPIYSS
jgi:hypothetical protein